MPVRTVVPAEQPPAITPISHQPEAYFEGRTFQPVTMARAVTGAYGETWLRVDQQGDFWHFDGRRWVRDPRQLTVAGPVLMALGNEVTRARTAEVEATLRTMLPVFEPRPSAYSVSFENVAVLLNGFPIGHQSAWLATNIIPHEYDPEASCPTFEAWLAEVVHPDVIPLVWEMIGYSMLQAVPYHRAFLLTGDGRNGKSLLGHVITKLLGPENVSSIPLQHLGERFNVAQLQFKLANIALDIPASFNKESFAFKVITAGDPIAAEHKNKPPFTFQPYSTLIFSANSIPGSADASAGFFERWVPIHFPNSFVGREDITLWDRLTTDSELRGIAYRAMEALQTLHERGKFVLPPSVIRAKEQFVIASDDVRAWTDDATHPSNDFLARKDLYESYTSWAKLNNKGIHDNSRTFYQKLRQLPNVAEVTIRGVRGFRGLALGGIAPATTYNAAELLQAAARAESRQP